MRVDLVPFKQKAQGGVTMETLKTQFSTPTLAKSREKSKEPQGLSVIPKCKCGEDLIIFWNGNCYCSETYNILTSNKNNGCSSTGWAPVHKMSPKTVRKIFGRKPEGYIGPADEIRLKIFKSATKIDD